MIANAPVKLTTPEAAEYVGATATTLNTWRCLGKGPAFIKVGRKVLYTQRDLDAWLDSRKVNCSSALDS